MLAEALALIHHVLLDSLHHFILSHASMIMAYHGKHMVTSCHNFDVEMQPFLLWSGTV